MGGSNDKTASPESNSNNQLTVATGKEDAAAQEDRVTASHGESESDTEKLAAALRAGLDDTIPSDDRPWSIERPGSACTRSSSSPDRERPTRSFSGDDVAKNLVHPIPLQRFCKSGPSSPVVRFQSVEQRCLPAIVSEQDLTILIDGNTVLDEKGENYYGGSELSASSGAIQSEDFRVRHEVSASLQSRGLVLVIVGLPARGKSFISRKLEGFFAWQCMRTENFNVGKYRRSDGGAVATGRADFFSSTNRAASKVRQDAAQSALTDLLKFLDSGGNVGIFDATNSTKERRAWIIDFVRKWNGKSKYGVVFVEVVCDDPAVIETNLRNKVLHSPDFAGLTVEEALLDLKKRIQQYEDVYETIDDDSTSYIKLYNMSNKVLVNRIYGFTARSMLPFLMGIHIGTRPIFLVRAAEVPKGGNKDARLTGRGAAFAENLGSFVVRRLYRLHGAELPEKPVRMLSSTMPSAVETVLATLKQSTLAVPLPTSSVNRFKQTPLLNPIDRGRLDGGWWVDLCTDTPPWDELQRRDPGFFSKWEANKLKTRFPGGESYYDVMIRVENALLEIEMSTRAVIVVSHITLLQVLVAYFSGSPLADAWSTSIPEHSVIEVKPTLGGGFVLETHLIGGELQEDLFGPDIPYLRAKTDSPKGTGWTDD